MHAIEFAFETPLAQHALSPANELEAVSIATAIRAIVVIFIMVEPQTFPIQELFNCLSVIQLVILSKEMFRFAQHDKTRPGTRIAAGTAASTVSR